MNYFIHTISEQTYHFLAGQGSGKVHSVYRKTINVSLNGRLLAIQALHSPLSPLSLITSLTENEMNFPGLTPGAPVSFDSHKIIVTSDTGSISFSCKNACRYDLNLAMQLPDTITHTQIAYLTRQIRESLAVCPSDGFAPLFLSGTDKSSVILTAAAAHISSCAKAYTSCDYQKAASLLCRLTGLGPGLTPSGDDFLCGVLAGLILTRKELHPFTTALIRTIKANLENTNDISAAFLTCAADGLFSLPVIRLAGLPDSGLISSLFREIGHSSGLDTLCGVLYATDPECFPFS